MRRMIVVAGVVLIPMTGCSSSEHVAELRDALDKAELSLADSVRVAETETSNGVGFRASLLVDANPVFSVGALAGGAAKDVRVDIRTGQVIGLQPAAVSAADGCPTIPLAESIAAAEAEVGGEAVAIEPDDDGFCNREVKVLSGDTLWEVKVAPDGTILETEEDDEG